MKLPLLSRPKESPKEKAVPDGWALTSGMVTAPDLIAPDGILEMSSCLQVGPDRYARTYVVTAIPSVLVVGWLDDLYPSCR